MLRDRVASALRAEDTGLALGYDAELGAELARPEDLVLLNGPRTPVFAAGSYSRSAPRHIGGLADADGLAAYFATLDGVYRRLPACVAVPVDGLIVRDRTLYVRTEGELRAIYETVRAVDRPYVELWDGARPAQAEIAFDQPGVTYVHLGAAGSFNYGHWLVDDLPRAAWLAQHREGLSIVIPSAGAEMDRVRLASLRLVLGEPMPPVTFLDPGATYVLARAAYVTPVSLHPVLKLPEAMHHVRSRAAAASKPASAPGAGAAPARRLFVTRAATRGRGIVNLDEVATRLSEAGFEPIDPETLSFEQQVEAFSHAEIVVGVMGAAMTNTLFSPAGCRVGYLAPEGWTEPFYWDLANVMGHPYFTLFGAPESSDLAPHLSSFGLELDALARFLDAMEAA